MDVPREAETSSPHPEQPDEPMEETHTEPVDLREPLGEAEEVEAGSGCDTVE